MPALPKYRLIRLILIGSIALSYTFSPTTLADDYINYGVQPFVPPIYLERIYGPLIKALSDHVGQPVQFRTRRSLAEYRKAINNQEFDIILVNPFEYIELRANGNYHGLVQRANRITSNFFVIDKNIDSLEKLRGKRIGFPPLEMANAILGLQKLHEVSLYPNQYKKLIFSEHLSCKQALSNGQVDACVSSPLFAVDRLQTYDKEFIAIASSRDIPSSVIMIHTRIQSLAQPLHDWFINLNNSEYGRELLTESILGELREVDDTAYDVVLEILNDRKLKGW